MKKRSENSEAKTIAVDKVVYLRKKEPTTIGVIDEEMQRKFPRLAVLSTQVVTLPKDNGHEVIRDSEPNLTHGR
jgi:hypothetical protein